MAWLSAYPGCRLVRPSMRLSRRAPCFAEPRHGENVRSPWRPIQVESARLQLVALPRVRRVTDHILESPLAVAEIRERQPHVTLTLVGGVVHRHQQALAARALPGKGQEALPSPIAVPGRDAV